MPEPVAISEAFDRITERSVERLNAAEEGDGITYEEVADIIASEFGVPAMQLGEAASSQAKTALLTIAVSGPMAISGAIMSAFLAGVLWEQGRSA